MFLKYAEASCTVFAVKDLLLGHNPLACVDMPSAEGPKVIWIKPQ
jgi:uncharacterized metal-binding protein